MFPTFNIYGGERTILLYNLPRKSNYLFVAVGQVGGACRDVQQTILQVGQYSKREKLVEILRNIGILH